MQVLEDQNPAEVVTVETLVDSTIVANDKLAQMLDELESLRLENAELRSKLNRIMVAVDRVRERQHRLANLKQQAKDAKTAHDRAVVDMLDAATEEEETPMPLFDRKPEPAKVTAVDANTETAPANPDRPNEEWRALSVTVLQLPVKLTETLLEQKPRPLETLGDLADFLATSWITDLKGVGAAKAKQIEEAWMQFWTDHPEYCSTDSADDTQISEESPVADAVPAAESLDELDDEEEEEESLEDEEELDDEA